LYRAARPESSVPSNGFEQCGHTRSYVVAALGRSAIEANVAVGRRAASPRSSLYTSAMRRGRKSRARACAICRKPFKASDDTLRSKLFPEDERTYVVHHSCLKEDWPRIEVGLERFS
jgi:hypothetical protein